MAGKISSAVKLDTHLNFEVWIQIRGLLFKEEPK